MRCNSSRSRCSLLRLNLTLLWADLVKGYPGWALVRPASVSARRWRRGSRRSSAGAQPEVYGSRRDPAIACDGCAEQVARRPAHPVVAGRELEMAARVADAGIPGRVVDPEQVRDVVVASACLDGEPARERLAQADLVGEESAMLGETAVRVARGIGR